MRSPSYSLALEIEDEIQVEEIQWQHRCSQLTKCMCLTTDPPPHQVLTSPDFFFFAQRVLWWLGGGTAATVREKIWLAACHGT